MNALGSMFAINHGDLGGQYIVLCGKSAKDRSFVSLPEKKIIVVPEADFSEGIEKDVITFVASLPDEVYVYCKEIYEKEVTNI